MSNGNGTTHLYRVEARSSTEPQKVCGQILTKEWKRVHFARSEVGILNETLVPIKDDYHNLLNYNAAMALATWFMAMPEEKDLPFLLPALCVETRIVKVKLTWSFNCEDEGTGEPMSLFEMQRAAKFELIASDKAK